MVSKNIHTRPWNARWVNEIEGTQEVVSIHDTHEEARFIGRTVPTTMNEVIEVKFTEIDNSEKVLLMEK